MDRGELKHKIFSIRNPQQFNDTAVEIFHYQCARNPVYRQFVKGLGIEATGVIRYQDIPFLPVSFFKTHQVLCEGLSFEAVFESSGTTGSQPSRHYVADFSLYEKSFTTGWELFYGPIREYTIFALLPSYQERKNASLVYMVERLRWKSDQQFGGFYLNEFGKLLADIHLAHKSGKKVLLIGVGFALLDLVEQFPEKIPEMIILETGGMKGRRKEITRMELHERLKSGFGVTSIHSEYGMTELFSQAWSKGEGFFHGPPWMQIRISDSNDPLTFLEPGSTGGINVIDLANLDSCSFIATQDLGRKMEDGSFEVLGRFDYSDVRGCSLMVP